MNSPTMPQIAGHRHVRLISDAGGYGDVHLFEEVALGRKVAVKVIRDAGLDADAVGQFMAEANLMAALEHPNIVRVYGAGRTSDGRPYVSMQYCPDDNMEARAGSGRLSVAEVLKVGIGVGSALESAHQAGLLHRDVKPANILMSPSRAPVLTDFGVAAKISEAESTDDVGVSPPWSPPEMLYTTTSGSPASDVYSLAATLWHLLVGRPPFEVPGGDNGTVAVLSRIRDVSAPLTGRGDVPESLERLLRHAMAKRPEQRPASMGQFVRSLQVIEAELHLPPTEAVVLDVPSMISPLLRTISRRELADGSGSTQLRPRQAGPVDSLASGLGGRGVPGPRITDGLAAAQTQLRPGHAGSALEGRGESATVLRPRVTDIEMPRASDPVPVGRSKGLLMGLGVLLLVVCFAVGYLAQAKRPRSTPQSTTPVSTTLVGAPDDAIPPGPVTVSGRRQGDTVLFSWDYSAARSSDTFQWKVEGGAAGVAKSPSLRVPSPPGTRVCLTVRVVRADGSNASRDWSTPGCVA